MSALLNTLLAALFPAILAPQEKTSVSLFPAEQPFVTVMEETEMEEQKIYFYWPV